MERAARDRASFLVARRTSVAIAACLPGAQAVVTALYDTPRTRLDLVAFTASFVLFVIVAYAQPVGRADVTRGSEAYRDQVRRERARLRISLAGRFIVTAISLFLVAESLWVGELVEYAGPFAVIAIFVTWSVTLNLDDATRTRLRRL